MTIATDIQNLQQYVFSSGVRYRTDGLRCMKDVGSDAYAWGTPKPAATPTATPATSGGAMADGVYKIHVVFENVLGHKGMPFADDAVSATVSGGSGAGKITVTVPVPGDAQVQTVMVYRTRVNEEAPFYLANWAAAGTTSISLVGDDDSLDSEDFLEPPDMLADNENSFAGPFRYVQPPTKSEVEIWDGRAWLACDRAYTAGRFSAVNGSTEFTGDINVSLDASMVGKSLHFTGEPLSYTIAEILSQNRFRAAVAYRTPPSGTDATNAAYEIKGDANSLRFSESNQVEYWPTGNELIVGDEDGGSLTAIKAYMDGLHCFTQSKIWTVYRTGSETMPYARRETVSHVGTNAPRSVVRGAAGLYFWGGDGFYRHANQSSALISDALGTMEHGWPRLIKNTDYIKGVLHRDRIYWACNTEDTTPAYLDTIFVYDVVGEVWDVWTGLRIIDLAAVTHEDGTGSIYIEVPCGVRYALCYFRWDNLNDGRGKQDFSGTATGGTTSSLECTDVSFPTDSLGLSGMSVTITGGTGIGQTRRIFGNTEHILNLESFWPVAPDTTSTFTVGQIYHSCESGEIDFGAPQELKKAKHVEFSFGRDL